MAERAADSCQPVFVTARALPLYGDRFPDTVEICSAAEKTAGRGTIRGAQRIRGLWRIYVKKQCAREKLLLEGFVFRGVQVPLLDANPYALSGEQDHPTTKLWIGDIPLSASDKDIESALVAKGCQLRSKLRNELARDRDGKLTQWETGRRFVFINIPSSPLPTALIVGIFTGSLYHREQAKKAKTCNKCLQEGHVTATCTSAVVCLSCRQPGHRRGECDLTVTQEDASTAREGRAEEVVTGEGYPEFVSVTPSQSLSEIAISESESAPSTPTKHAEKEEKKQKKKKDEKKKGKIQTVLNAIRKAPHTNPAAKRRALSEDEEEGGCRLKLSRSIVSLSTDPDGT